MQVNVIIRSNLCYRRNKKSKQRNVLDFGRAHSTVLKRDMNHTKGMNDHTLVCTNTTLLLRTNAVYNTEWSRNFQIDQEYNRQYRATRAMGHWSIRIRLRRGAQIWCKTAICRRVILSTNDRARPNSRGWWHTSLRYRRAGKYRWKHPHNNHLWQRENPTRSNRRTTNLCTADKERTIARKETWQILLNYSFSPETDRHGILNRSPKKISPKIDSRGSYLNCGTRNALRTLLILRTTCPNSRISRTEMYVWHA